MLTELLTRILKPEQHRQAREKLKCRITDIEKLTNVHPVQIEYDITQAARQSHFTRYETAFHIQGYILQGYPYRAAVNAVRFGYKSGFDVREEVEL